MIANTVTIDGRKVHNRTFGSLAEWVDYCSETESQVERRESRAGDRKADWTGTESFEAAQSLAFAWQAGADRVARIAARINPSNKNRQETVSSVVGPGVISMGNYLSGHPKAFLVRRDTDDVRSGSGKVLKIQVNIAVSCAIGTDVIERRGAAVLALCSALERAGKRVEIEIIVSGGFNSGDKCETVAYRVTAKKPGEKINLLTLAFAIAHPSMFRRFAFSAMECEPDERIRHGLSVPGHYSYPNNVPGDADALYLGRMFGHEPAWRNEESAEAWVRETAEAQGVRF